MFKSLQDFLSNKLASLSSETDQNNEPSDAELQLAAATLMFEVVRSDGKIDDVELDTMATILRKQFSLEEDDIDTMLALAQQTSDEAISLHSFTRDICQRWGNTQRMELLENLWIIALADKKIDVHERHLVRKVASLLYLTEIQIVQSRENAKVALGIESLH
ncbi:MAG: TerB family tellurite resistance protein [Pseudomonadota bacterium]